MERVLIVDDEPMVSELLRRFLEAEGFEVDTAVTGAEALERMRRDLPNIVLCDIRLPDVDGKDLLGALKAIHPMTNVVMITGYTSMENVVECLGGGAADYFTKPFRDIDALVAAVKGLREKVARWKRSTPIVPR